MVERCLCNLLRTSTQFPRRRHVSLLWQARRPVSRRRHGEAQSPILTPFLLLHTTLCEPLPISLPESLIRTVPRYILKLSLNPALRSTLLFLLLPVLRLSPEPKSPRQRVVQGAVRSGIEAHVGSEGQATIKHAVQSVIESRMGQPSRVRHCSIVPTVCQKYLKKQRP